MEIENNIIGIELPHLMTVKEIAKTGLMTEYTLRALIKQGKVPHVKVGAKVLINLELFVKQLNNPDWGCA